MKKIFEIGIVTGVHGIKGDIKVFPYTSDPENLSKQKYFLINGKETEVNSGRVQGKFLILHLKGIESIEEAEKLKNTLLSLPRKNAAPLTEGVYYMDDLIGCNIFEYGVNIGKLGDILETGANDVYVIVSKNGTELLLPAIKDVVLKIDIDNRRIDVKIPEGLTDDEYF